MNVVVYGAGGWTGTLTAQALERRGVNLVLAGRSEEKLLAVQRRLRSRPRVQVAAIDDAEALGRALAGSQVVVNCSGPYLELGHQLIEAALRAGCHYFDATGEHSFLREVYDRHQGDARRRGVTLCPAFAAKGALGDWGSAMAAASLSPMPRADEVAIAYAHGLREYFQPSPGSVLSAAGQGFLKPVDDHDPGFPVARRFRFPPPFGAGLALLVPGAEDISVPRHMDVPIVRSYLSMAPGSMANEPWARLCLQYMPWVPAISGALRSAREPLAALLREPRQEKQRDSFMVAIEVAAGGRRVRVGIATTDAYVVTAEILAYGVEQLRARGGPAGVVPPSRLCAPGVALEALSTAGALRVARCRGAA